MEKEEKKIEERRGKMTQKINSKTKIEHDSERYCDIK